MPKTLPICITLEFQDGKLHRSALSLAPHFQVKIEGHPDKSIEKTLLDFLKGYSEHKHTEVILPLDTLTPFRKKVLQQLQKVPFGTVTTYGELASESGHPGAARAVGTACHFNPFPLFIPCHRVIAAGGKLGGFALDMRIKKALLDFEASID
jgi:methylated-DNA-[protein]-cysteine S-methyltransferase